MTNLPESLKKKLIKLKKSFDKCKVKAKISEKIRKESFEVSPKSNNINLTFNRDPNSYWTLVSIISDGGFGRIFKAKNKQNNFYSAAKIIEYCDKDDLNDHMVEIDILNECVHKNIVKLFNAYYFDSTLWMVFEYCESGSIESLINDLNKPLAEIEIQFVIKEVLEALVYLHDTCLVFHRDIKAANILLKENGSVKLSDFSVAAKNTTTLQRRNSFIGSPLWMSPEVISCETDKTMWYDNRTDIWSLGITCIELAETRPPYDDLPHSVAMMKILKYDSSPKLSEPQKWSKKFISFVRKCLIKDKTQRLFAQQLIKHSFIKGCKKNQEVMISLLKLRAEYLTNLINTNNDITSNCSKYTIDSVFEYDQPMIQTNDTVSLDVDDNESEIMSLNSSLANRIFEDICLEVIGSEYERPSVPDCILDSFKEIFDDEIKV